MPFRYPSGKAARPNSGFTMIELVSAMALLALILGILLIALNSATNLWNNSRAQRRELPTAQHIADLIADDLYQAVADPIPPTNGASTVHNTFILQNLATNDTPADPVILLAFPRIASPRTLDPDLDASTRLSLDAVFYTTYSNALFRLAFPIHTQPDRSESLGQLFETYIPTAKVLQYHTDALFPEDQPPEVSITLLAVRAVPEFIAYFSGQTYPTLFETFETNALPDCIDFAIHLFNSTDWNAYQTIKNDYSDEANAARAHLGTLISRRITPPQKGGMNLP